MDTQELEDGLSLTERWRNRANRNAHIHYACENYYSKLNYLLGIPTIVLSSMVGASVFASIDSEATGGVKIIIGVVSFMAAILASLQTFLNYSERSEKHRITSAKYGAVRRRLEYLKSFHSNSDEHLNSELKEIEKELDAIAVVAPGAPPRIRAKFSKQYEEGDAPDINRI